MREIEFRGQRVDNGEWVYGMPLESKFNCTYMLTKQGGLNADFIHSRYTILDSKDSIVVKTETIGAFTGLLDKNGNKIFEGDIVKGVGVTSYDKPVIRRVSFDDKSARFGLTSVNENITFDPLNWISFPLEIIGNIHEDGNK